ncbi:MAG: hypothetical protein GY854_24310 [Deltaproteobacteria bacterium]|nr:hypothetical protein [Deltaproteobacteria bacterium]
MSKHAKLLFGATMVSALLFGFLHPLWPDSPVSFKRLHIFLFNLLTGGSLILYYTEGTKFTKRVRLYFGLALVYALLAASGLYIPMLLISIPLLLTVEWVRIKRFSLFPFDFFSRTSPVGDKFNQAALLCLSIGIVFASLVTLNNEYLHLVSYEKLTLEVFFLGYSFPVSLITMSLMFSFMTERTGPVISMLKEVGFWFVNLGVIIFFVFIIFGMGVAEMVVATILFFAVFMIFFLFLFTAPPLQQKTFLISGMVFLLTTALTGIFYILQYFFPSLDVYREHLLNLHAMVSLYGWNLSGLFIIIRWHDFPIRLNSAVALSLHWAIVLVLAPLGKVFPLLFALAMVAYVTLLLIVFAGRSDEGVKPR